MGWFRRGIPVSQADLWLYVFTGYATEVEAKTDLSEFVSGGNWMSSVTAGATVTGQSGFCVFVKTPDVRDDIFDGKANCILQVDLTKGVVDRTKIAAPSLSSIQLSPLDAVASAAHHYNETGLTYYRPVPPSTSFWRKRVDEDAELHPNTAGFQTRMAAAMAVGATGFNTLNFSAPVEVAPIGATTQDITPIAGDPHPLYSPAEDAEEFEDNICNDVLLPSGAEWAGGTDREMTVWEPATDNVREFWKMSLSGSTYRANRGGLTDNTLTEPGIYPTPFGVAASGDAMVYGQINVDEVLYTGIQHAVAITMPNGHLDSFRVYLSPATRSDGDVSQSTTLNPFPYGLRFYLPSDYDTAAWEATLHPIAYQVLLAAKTYGLQINDRGGTIGFRAENEKPRIRAGLVSRWVDIFDGAAGFEIMDDFPFEDLVAKPAGFGGPSWGPGLLKPAAYYQTQSENFTGLSGSNILSAIERSGMGIRIANDGTKVPVWTSQGWSATRNSWNFTNASQSYLSSSGQAIKPNLTLGGDELTLGVAVKITTEVVGAHILSLIGGSGETVSLQDASGAFKVFRDGAEVGSIARSTNTGYFLMAKFDGANCTISLYTVGGGFVDGTPVASTGDFDATATLTIGNNFADLTKGMTGRIQEPIFVLTHAITAGERTSLASYLSGII